MRTDNLVCDIDEWIREAESSTREFNDRKEKLAAFRDAGWWDNGSTYLSYYKRFTTKSGTEYFTEVSLSSEGNLIWSRGGGLANLGTQEVSLEDAEKIIDFVRVLEERTTSNE